MLPPITNKKMAVQQQLGDYITTANVHFLIREKPWVSLTPPSRALSKSQNWLAEPWPDWSFWLWNRTFTKSFCWKIISSLPCRRPAITHTVIIWIAAISPAKIKYRHFDCNKLSLLWTLGNEDTNLRSLQCPLEGELT